MFMAFSQRREIRGSSEGYEGTDDMSRFIHNRLLNEGSLSK